MGVVVAARVSFEANGQHLVYALDDPYIHMAIAKNLALHGVFGLTRYEFSSSTSSPLWTLLLAASYRLVGVKDWVPGIWAVGFAFSALYTTNVLCRFFGLRLFPRFITCCAVLYFTPLLPLVATGMEHAMHLFLVLLLILLTVRFLDIPSRLAAVFMCSAGLLATATRYETLFLVAPLVCLLLHSRHWVAGSAFAISSALPVFAYGLFSLSNGSYFLPNSLMLKGHFPAGGGYRAAVDLMGYHGFGILTATDHLFSISVMLLFGAYCFHKQRRVLFAIVMSVMCALLLHLQFASTGWFFRYEAYLVGVSMVLLGCLYLGPEREGSCLTSCNHVLPRVSLLVCIVLLLWPLHRRAKEALEKTVPISNHIYQQQFQMGQFLKNMYEPGVRVGVNDVGAVAYYADVAVLDLWGLGSIEVARAKREGMYDAESLERLLKTHKTDVVIVFTNWFPNMLPSNLVSVCSWTTSSNYSSRAVTFFGVSPEKAVLLENRLRQYQTNLPECVTVSYMTDARSH